MIFWTVVEKVENISFLKKYENDSCDGFLHYFASPENSSATLQPVCDSESHIGTIEHVLENVVSPCTKFI